MAEEHKESEKQSSSKNKRKGIKRKRPSHLALSPPEEKVGIDDAKDFARYQKKLCDALTNWRQTVFFPILESGLKKLEGEQLVDFLCTRAVEKNISVIKRILDPSVWSQKKRVEILEQIILIFIQYSDQHKDASAETPQGKLRDRCEQNLHDLIFCLIHKLSTQSNQISSWNPFLLNDGLQLLKTVIARPSIKGEVAHTLLETLSSLDLYFWRSGFTTHGQKIDQLIEFSKIFISKFSPQSLEAFVKKASTEPASQKPISDFSILIIAEILNQQAIKSSSISSIAKPLLIRFLARRREEYQRRLLNGHPATSTFEENLVKHIDFETDRSFGKDVSLVQAYFNQNPNLLTSLSHLVEITARIAPEKMTALLESEVEISNAPKENMSVRNHLLGEIKRIITELSKVAKDNNHFSQAIEKVFIPSLRVMQLALNGQEKYIHALSSPFIMDANHPLSLPKPLISIIWRYLISPEDLGWLGYPEGSIGKDEKRVELRSLSLSALMNSSIHVKENPKPFGSLTTAAAFYGNVEKLQLLAEDKQSLETADEQGRTPATMAAKYGKIEVLTFLKNSEVDLTQPDRDGWTPATIAAREGQFDVLNFLISNHIHIENQDGCGNTPATIAAETGNVHILRLLMIQGMKRKNHNSKDEHVGVIAARTGNIEILKCLREFYPGTALTYSGDNSPVIIAAKHGQIKVLEFLKDNGINLNSSTDNYSPATVAARHGKIEVLQFLRNNGVNLSLSDPDGCNPVTAAAMSGQTSVVEFLKNKDTDFLTQPDSQGRTAATIAAEHQQIKILKLLRNNGIDLNAPDSRGITPITAAPKGAQKVIDFLNKEKKQVPVDQAKSLNASSSSASFFYHSSAESNLPQAPGSEPKGNSKAITL